MKEEIYRLAELHKWDDIAAYRALKVFLDSLSDEVVINDSVNFGAVRATFTKPVMTSVRITPTFGAFNIQVRSEPVMFMVTLPTIEVQNA